MAKYGMSMCVLGMAEELKSDGIAVNALWPRTGIHAPPNLHVLLHCHFVHCAPRMCTNSDVGTIKAFTHKLLHLLPLLRASFIRGSIVPIYTLFAPCFTQPSALLHWTCWLVKLV